MCKATGAVDFGCALTFAANLGSTFPSTTIGREKYPPDDDPDDDENMERSR